MDKFTRVYSLALLVGGLAVLVSVFYEPPVVSDLNAQLKSNKTLAAYPYRFRVIDVTAGMATITTPRTAEFPTSRALPLLYPELRSEGTDSAAFLEAQQEMARVQGVARQLVTGHEDIEGVTWTLDTKWLRDNGINPDLVRTALSDTK
jgi:hypothetical protein